MFLLNFDCMIYILLLYLAYNKIQDKNNLFLLRLFVYRHLNKNINLFLKKIPKNLFRYDYYLI